MDTIPDNAEIGRLMEIERRKAAIVREAEALADQLAHFASAMSPERQDALADAIANKHPTYIGQIAKVVGIGVMRRATYEPWRPYGIYHRECSTTTLTQPVLSHAEHDGRLDCTTVIGAELMARQSFI